MEVILAPRVSALNQVVPPSANAMRLPPCSIIGACLAEYRCPHGKHSRNHADGGIT